ncbi:MAG: c-type cytochrome domain-containing protein, partial [Chthoniobacteraceae bacterium]
MKRLLLASIVAFSAADSRDVLAAPLEIAPLIRTTTVDFEREVAPFLRDNCFSCHCKTTTKGGLNMETPELILKGGDTGPSLKPGKGAESLLLQAAAHQDDDLKMPPRDNKAKAKNLTPQQLALLRLWIDQGAKASPKSERVLAWQPLPEGANAIFSVAITPDAQFAACSRANRISIYHVPSARLVANEAAHRDQVNALAFSPDGTLLASGGYREVKLWRRASAEGKPVPQPPAAAAVAGKIARGDGQRSVVIEGSVAKLSGADGKVIAELRGNRYARESADERDRALQVQTGSVAFRKAAVATAEKALQAAQDRAKKSADAVAPKQVELTAKEKALADAKAAKPALDKVLADAEGERKKADEKLQAAAVKAAQLSTAATDALKGAAAVDANKLVADVSAALQEAAKARTEREQMEAKRKQAADKIEPLAKQITAAEGALKLAATAKDVAETEVRLAKAEQEKSAAGIAEAKAAVATAEAARKKAEDAAKAARDAATAAEQPIRAAAFSADGAMVATAGDDNLIHTWSAETGAAFDVLKGHKAPVTALVFSTAQSAPGAPGGELISTAGDGLSLSWNLSPAWKPERTIGSDGPGSPFADRVNALAFSPDGRFLAIGGGEPSRGGEIKIWDIQSGRFAREFPNTHSDTVLALEFSADGRFLASGAADKIARVTDLSSGKVVKSFEGHTHHILGVAWSLDGRTLATAGADSVVKVWDFTTGDRKKNIEGYDKEVTSVHFVGAGEQVLTSSGDNKVRLVGLDGKEARVFPDVADFMQSAAVSADGKTVLAGGQDGVLRVWNA